jgi:hypothetical protein
MHRTLLEGRADRAEWPILYDTNLDRRYMIDERATPDGQPVGTLVRIDSSTGERKEAIADVLGYGPGAGHLFQYTKYVAGAALPELHLRDGEGHDRNLGPVNGPALFTRRPVLYFLDGERTLSTVATFDAPVVALRAHVQRFLLGFSLPEDFVVAEVVDEGRTHTVVLDLGAKAERVLPVEACCWLYLHPPTFAFSTQAADGASATLHEWDVTTGADRVLALPAPMVNVASLELRPPKLEERLLLDGYGHVVAHRPAADPPLVVLPSPMATPRFTSDGRALLYVDVAPPHTTEAPPPGGALLLLDADDWTRPPRRVSPEGVAVPAGGFFMTPGAAQPLVFWGRESGELFADLYLGNHETGTSTRIARAVLATTMSGDRLVGVWNAQPDLRGELRVRVLSSGDERGLEHGVSEYALDQDRLAFVVRGASAMSKRNGLWATQLPAAK